MAPTELILSVDTSLINHTLTRKLRHLTFTDPVLEHHDKLLFNSDNFTMTRLPLFVCNPDRMTVEMERYRTLIKDICYNLLGCKPIHDFKAQNNSMITNG